MQTFLPFRGFAESAEVLDRQRLGKQRVECLQIIQTLLEMRVDAYGDVVPFKPKGWVNHPATRMWEGYTSALGVYTLTMIQEWVKRGYDDGIENSIKLLIPGIQIHWTVRLPPWLGDEAFHRSHRSNLIRKLPAHYRQVLGWTEPDNLPYVWPVS